VPISTPREAEGASSWLCAQSNDHGTSLSNTCSVGLCPSLRSAVSMGACRNWPMVDWAHCICASDKGGRRCFSRIQMLISWSGRPFFFIDRAAALSPATSISGVRADRLITSMFLPLLPFVRRTTATICGAPSCSTNNTETSPSSAVFSGPKDICRPATCGPAVARAIARDDGVAVATASKVTSCDIINPSLNVSVWTRLMSPPQRAYSTSQ